jgi:hypothetical protein
MKRSKTQILVVEAGGTVQAVWTDAVTYSWGMTKSAATNMWRQTPGCKPPASVAGALLLAPGNWSACWACPIHRLKVVNKLVRTHERLRRPAMVSYLLGVYTRGGQQKCLQAHPHPSHLHPCNQQTALSTAEPSYSCGCGRWGLLTTGLIRTGH